MVSRLVLVLLLIAIVLPSSALAAKKPVKYRAGQVCNIKKEATYVKHGFSCVNGHLRKNKK